MSLSRIGSIASRFNALQATVLMTASRKGLEESIDERRHR
jgi:hypothetical protein